MRRLLYSLIFVTVLLLAGSVGLTGIRAGDVPGDTVPANTVWLPMVERGLTLFEQYPFCVYLINPISPPDGITVRAGEPVTFTFTFENQNMGWPGGLNTWNLSVLTTTVEPPYTVGGNGVNGSSDQLNNSDVPITITLDARFR